jgi:hypothetical protein
MGTSENVLSQNRCVHLSTVALTVKIATTRQTVLAIGRSGRIPIEHPEAYGLCFPPTKEGEKLRKLQVCIT